MVMIVAFLILLLLYHKENETRRFRVRGSKVWLRSSSVVIIGKIVTFVTINKWPWSSNISYMIQMKFGIKI